MNSIKKFRTLKIDDLYRELILLRKEQLLIRMKKVHGLIHKTHIIKNIRRKIAQIKTIISEKK